MRSWKDEYVMIESEGNMKDKDSKSTSSTSFNVPTEGVGNEANAGPAVLVHSADVLHAVQINWEIFALLLSCLVADGERFVDIVDAQDLQVVGAFLGCGDGSQAGETD